MNVTLRKIGNSEGVILPKEVLERLNLQCRRQPHHRRRMARSWLRRH